MIYGRKCILQSITSIFGSKKGIYSRRESICKYVRTTSFDQVDALSRLIANRQHDSDEDIIIGALDAVEELANDIHELPVTFQDIVKATNADPVLVQIKKFILNNWSCPNDDEHLKPFFCQRDDLTILKDCIMYKSRVVVPERLQKRILKSLYDGPGIQRMKQNARAYVYWPNLGSQIEQLVKQCSSVHLVLKQQKILLNISFSLGLSLSRLGNECIWTSPAQSTDLIIVGSYSKFPEIQAMSAITSTALINVLINDQELLVSVFRNSWSQTTAPSSPVPFLRNFVKNLELSIHFLHHTILNPMVKLNVL